MVGRFVAGLHGRPTPRDVRAAAGARADSFMIETLGGMLCVDRP